VRSAAWATDEVPENPAGSTVALSVNFAATADGIDLRAEAKVVRRGGRLSFCEVRVTDPGGRTARAWDRDLSIRLKESAPDPTTRRQ
jgi:acyl-coenzyme A thioesterase PaaI-like protein